MSRGRKPNPTSQVVDDDFDPSAASGMASSLTELAARSVEISQRFGDGLPYDRSRCIGLTRNALNLGAVAMLEAGKQLIQIKENEAHGEFIEIVEEQLGIHRRTAARMMTAAAKFLSPRLAANWTTLSNLGAAKLYDLMAESDEDIEELTKGGTLAGKTFDELDAMSAREMKAALTEAKKKLAAQQKVIQAKSSKVDELTVLIEGNAAAPLDEIEEQQLNDLRTRTLDAEVSLQQLLALVDDITTQPATQATELAARHSLDYLVQRIVDGCLARGITVDLADRVSPIWAEPIEEAAKGGRKGRK